MPQPLVTVDIVLTTLKEGKLQVALCRRDKDPYEGSWALPGGWVRPEEDADALESAMRILKEKTGLVSPYLEQLAAFSGAHRDPRSWSVSLAYYAVVPQDLIGCDTPENVEWVVADTVRSLPFDHLTILKTALARVQSKTVYSSLPFYLMPKKFTLTQLQSVYETLIGGPLDKRGFRRWVEGLDLLRAVAGGAQAERAQHRPAQYFSLKDKSKGTLALTGKSLEPK